MSPSRGTDEDPDRFRRLFADLEARAEAETAWDDEARTDEMARSAVGSVALTDRLRVAPGPVTVVVRGAGTVRGRVQDVGADVVELVGQDQATWAVALGAVLWVDGLDARAADPLQIGTADARLGLGALLRRWVRDRLPVTVYLVEGGTLTGTPDRAAADHLDLAEHDPDEPRRAQAVRRVVAVPYPAIAAVRRR